MTGRLPLSTVDAAALLPREFPMPWEEARRHPRLKEEVFQSLLSRYGNRNRVGEGRGLLMDAALKSLPHFYRLCPEIKILRDRIGSHFAMDSLQ